MYEVAMFEIIATANNIDGIETQGIYVGTQSTLEMDVVATSVMIYAKLDTAIRALGLTPAIHQYAKQGDGKHGLRLMIDVVTGWRPPSW